MNKVITINLGGTAYQLEEGGYDALRTYLDTAAARLQGNPDHDEILSDIERAFAEKFRALLGNNKTVVETKEVTAALAEMGPIEAGGGEPSAAGAAGAGAPGESGGAKTGPAGPTPGSGGGPRRLYRIPEGRMWAGVCNGLAAYFNIDPTFVRLGFVVLTLFWLTGLVVYVVMAIVVPKAETAEEKTAAFGPPPTAQEFIRRAKEGYYDTMKHFPDRAARREWKRQFRREMRANAEHWRYGWQNYWAQQGPVHPGMGFTLPILSLLSAAATVFWLCAIFSLVTTGALFGLTLPDHLPVWAAVLVVSIVLGIVTGPIKMARRWCYWGMGRSAWGAPVFLADALVWIAMIGTLVWLAVHHPTDVRDAVVKIPDLVHQAADDIRNWWHANANTNAIAK
jgi:phage shock protein PspC (stress-responsive transcriptional regulator)